MKGGVLEPTVDNVVILILTGCVAFRDFNSALLASRESEGSISPFHYLQEGGM